MTVADEIFFSLNRAHSRNNANVPADVDEKEWRYSIRCAANTILWVVNTARFSGSEMYALRDCRLYDLLRNMAMAAVKEENHTEDFLYKFLRNYKPFLKHLREHIDGKTTA